MTDQRRGASKKDYTVFVRNLDYEVDRDELRDFLEQKLSETESSAQDTSGLGFSLFHRQPVQPARDQDHQSRIKSVQIATDPETGKSRGFAFVNLCVNLCNHHYTHDALRFEATSPSLVCERDMALTY